MTVKAILSRKGTDVLTIEPSATLAAAVKLLADRKLGAVVITGADRQVIGILSERDIVRAFAAVSPASSRSATWSNTGSTRWKKNPRRCASTS